jgi:hypothetical protein
MSVGTPFKSAEHTPGPWKITGYAFISDCRSPIRAIARTEPSGEDDPICWPEDGTERSANARLIAAAPDGLALAEKVAASVSCGSCRKGNNDSGATCCMAREFIRKATGC